MKLVTSVFLLITMGLSAQTASLYDNLYGRAKLQFDKTDYSTALKILETNPNRAGRDWNLSGRSLFMLGDYKRATEAFEKAVQSEPNVSTHWHWLGRTFGRRAEISTFLTAPGYASKARQNFEKAVQLDSRNAEAVNDLFEYYLQAPGFLGGGLDKAQSLLDKIGAIDPAEKHYAMARLAEQKKDFRTAETQLRRAVDAAPKQIGRIVDLAKFLAKQGRTQESDTIFEQAKSVNPNHPVYLWQRANTFIEQKRNLTEAQNLLQRYLSTQVAPDDDHKDEAKKLLAKIGA